MGKMSVPCAEIITDIEDLISSQDITPKERYSSRKNVTLHVKKKVHKEISPPILTNIIPGTQTVYVKTWGCAHNNSDSEYMAGQLSAYGYKLTDSAEEADLWLLNSCTVKGPAEIHFRNEIERGQKLGKHVVAAGCVPQGTPRSEYLKGLSIIGVQNIDRVVEVVEETLKGHSVRLLSQKRENGKKLGGANLLLPKVRKNKFIEIIPISTGCLNQCTYCKTKHARGELGSYPITEIVDRAKQAFEENIVELWITSEDTGAYGRDIGSSLPELIWQIIAVTPESCRIRIGMTNPPYILEHLNEMGKILSHPKVYSFLHIPVQSGSDSVLSEMKREYTRSDFKHVVDFLKERVPGLTIATDIICGFPTETEEDFKETLSLCQEYKFPSLFINQFYPRPGTPAAKMTKIPAKEVKERTKELSEFFQTYNPYTHKLGEIQEVLVTETAHDNIHYVGHNKFYEQVLVPKNIDYMGKMLRVKIIDTKKHCLIGTPINSVTSVTSKVSVKFSRTYLSCHQSSYMLLFFVLILARLLWLLY